MYFVCKYQNTQVFICRVPLVVKKLHKKQNVVIKCIVVKCVWPRILKHIIDNVSLWVQKAVQKQEQEEEGAEHPREEPQGVEAGVEVEVEKNLKL
jgi:uncharacterized circularly permuted ATP-grasp superfamily protein